MEGLYETVDSGSLEKRIDIGSNVETRRQESLRTPGSIEISDNHSEAVTRHKGKPDDGQETSGRGDGGRGRGTVSVGHPLHWEA